MGYEQKFYIIRKHKSITDNILDKKYSYARIIAMVDYSRDNSLADFIDEKGKDTDSFVYIDNPNVPQTTDRYGQQLREIELGQLLEYLEKNPDENHRLYKPFLELIRTFKESNEEDLAVLRYGY